MYYTGIDPFTKKPVRIAKGTRDRKVQRALMQFLKRENWFTVREILIEVGRADLIGCGCDYLIPAQPPKEAIEARRRRANDQTTDYHTVANPARARSPASVGRVKPTGYRPGRKSQQQRNQNGRRQDPRP
jgi:hypothetical protein